ncbi:MAG: hypothetical protein JWR33_1789 [Naasia sp.]|jgi:uncharacterized protein YndB with AHSA1/START domain|uniref:SRPBCC family protein n=1 Tax=Naasia sp. TaxID=2546198 RepID=UPI00260AE262|nr:SRPBCC domain-containing protein [Naasia sp.]MCU1571048.1 hypothetical protein [Naasia sp.]
MTEVVPQEVTDRDIRITRAFNAPRDVVWRFFTEPALIATWFGPNLYRTPAETVTVEPYVGGAWKLAMVESETGDVAPMVGRIVRIEPPEYLELLVGAHSSDTGIEDNVLRIRFDDHGGKTRVTLHQGPFELRDRDLTREGWEESFVKMDASFPADAS